jgi:hypothetical protein
VNFDRVHYISSQGQRADMMRHALEARYISLQNMSKSVRFRKKLTAQSAFD